MVVVENQLLYWRKFRQGKQTYSIMSFNSSQEGRILIIIHDDNQKTRKLDYYISIRQLQRHKTKTLTFNIDNVTNNICRETEVILADEKVFWKLAKYFSNGSFFKHNIINTRIICSIYRSEFGTQLDQHR